MERIYLEELRTSQNESQQEVAEALGISRQYYHMIEHGERQSSMNVNILYALANHFDISVLFLVEKEVEFSQKK